MGLVYRDRVTGFVGVAIGRTVWLSGSPTISLQAPALANGKVPASVGFDEPRLELVPATAAGPLGL